MENYELKTNTILHTKDGRKIGNAIIIGKEGDYWLVKTDYGNVTRLTTEEIHELFYIAWVDFTKENEGRTCEEMQMISAFDHKHRAEKSIVGIAGEYLRCEMITGIDEDGY